VTAKIHKKETPETKYTKKVYSVDYFANYHNIS